MTLVGDVHFLTLLSLEFIPQIVLGSEPWDSFLYYGLHHWSRFEAFVVV